MRRILLISGFVIFTIAASSQNISFAWVKQFSGTLGKGLAIEAAANGDIYSAGLFSGSTDFDPGPAVYTLTPVSGQSAYLSRLDPNGNFVWARHIDKLVLEGKPFTMDQTDHLYLGGSFTGTIDMDPGAGTLSLVAGAARHGALARFDTDGNLVWARQFPCSGSAFSILNITTDGNGNVLLTGKFNGQLDSDPGSASEILTATGEPDVFIIKLDKDGNFLWSRQLTGPGEEAGHSLSTDPSGNVYIAGSFSTSIDADPGPGTASLVSHGSTDFFILKLSGSGNYYWVRQIGGSSLDMATSIAVGTSGYFYVTGFFSQSVDFDSGPGATVLSSNGALDVFLLKLDYSGSLVWAKTIGGVANDRSFDLHLNAADEPFITGTYHDDVDFDPGPSEVHFISKGMDDVFILKFAASGILTWVRVFGGPGNDISHSVTTDYLERIYSTGEFNQTADFDPAFSTFFMTPSGNNNAYVHKLNSCEQSSDTTLVLRSCGPLTLNNQTYSNSGVFTQTLVNTAGCDSLIILELSIGATETSSVISACETYWWQGQVFSQSGFYSDTLTSQGGCDSILHLALTIHHPVDTSFSISVCEGESIEGYTETGQYIETFQGAGGCDSTRTLNLTVHPAPQPRLGNDLAICSDTLILLQPGSFTSYTWQDGSRDGQFIARKAGTYWVRVSNAEGCERTDSLLLLSKNCIPGFHLPSAFSPDGNGRNDVFKAVSDAGLVELHISVFNRYGNMVFESNQPLFEWKGDIGGQPAPVGVYVWLCRYRMAGQPARTLSGTLSLIR